MATHPAEIPQRRHLWLLLVAAALLSAPAAAAELPPPAERVATEFAQCKHFFPAGLPPTVPKAPLQRELCFSGFALLHNGQTKTPVFVAEHLTRSVLEAGRGLRRGRHFYPEARLPSEERAEIEDYRDSGYSRGHMVPAGDMGTAQGKAQTFSLANMAPQDVELNNGAWNDIEQATRHYVQRAEGSVYVFTGPVYSSVPQAIGANGVMVPDHFYKLVYDASNGRSWAHWQANVPARRVSEPISYEELVQRTGIEFVPR